jgi:hypothetical protein
MGEATEATEEATEEQAVMEEAMMQDRVQPMEQVMPVMMQDRGQPTVQVMQQPLKEATEEATQRQETTEQVMERVTQEPMEQLRDQATQEEGLHMESLPQPRSQRHRGVTRPLEHTVQVMVAMVGAWIRRLRQKLLIRFSKSCPRSLRWRRRRTHQVVLNQPFPCHWSRQTWERLRSLSSWDLD